MKFHKTCKTLSIHAFTEIISSKDYRFLLKDFDEYESEDLKLGGDEVLEAQLVFSEILLEYAELSKNRKLLQSYQSLISIEKELFRYNLTIQILKSYNEYGSIDVLMILNKLDWRITPELEIEKQVQAVLLGLKKLKTKIAVLRIKHDEKFNKKENKEEEIISLDQQATSLEISLKLSYLIDVKKISVSKWISMCNINNKVTN